MAKQSGPRTRSYGVLPKDEYKYANLDYRMGSSEPCSEPLSLTPWITDTYSPYYDYTVMTDVVTPNFRKRIRAGELILNPMSWSRVAFEAADGSSASCSQGRPIGTSQYCNDRYLMISGSMNLTYWFMKTHPPSCPLLDVDVTSDEQVIISAVAGVDPTTYHVMEDVLQLRQFSESLLHPIQGMKDIAVQYARARTRAKALANAWAKYRFELLPLLGTAEALIRTALGPAKRLEPGIRLRSSSTTSGHDHGNGTATDSSGGYTYAYNQTRTIRKRAVVYYTLSRAHSGISQSLGTRFKDLPTGLWNTMTLTFMIDRLINISQFITAISNLCDPDIHVEGGCLTVWDYSRSENQLLQLVNNNQDGVQIIQFDTKPVIMMHDNVERTIVNPITTATSPLNLDFRPQDLVSNTSRVLDLLAITIQKLKL